MNRLALASLLLAAALPARADGLPDPGFGSAGFVVEGFQPHAAGGPIADADIGIVACAGPQGRLVASGIASGLTRVVTMFLTSNGELDAGVGFGGKVSVPLPDGAKTDVRGLCQADGKPVLAYNLARSTDPDRPHHVIELLRLDPATGQPDPGFGVGGTVRLDLETQFGRTATQRPMGLLAGPNGDVIVMGAYERLVRPDVNADDVRSEHAFVVRLTASGGIAAMASGHAMTTLPRRFVGGGVEGATLRLAGSAGETPRTPAPLIEIELDYPSLALSLATEYAQAPAVVPYGARVIDGKLATAASIAGAPAVVLSRSEDLAVRSLPLPMLDGRPADVFNAQLAGDASAIWYAASLARDGKPAGIYAAKLVGSEGAARVDPRFGRGGHVVVPAPVQCAADRVLAFARFTFWQGALTAIGAVERACSQSDPDYDYAVLRLGASLFRDSFDERYPLR